MKKLILILFLFPIVGFSQQDFQFTMFWNNITWFNPGAIGVDYDHRGVLSGRNQWAQFDGNPITIGGSYDLKINPLHGGLGISYVYDRLGFEANNHARLNYSYHFDLGNDRVLGSGLAVGFSNKSLSATWITPDGTPASNDPAINTNTGPNSSNISQTVFDMDIGVYYSAPKLKLGFSTTHLLEPDMDNLNVQNVRHFWLYGGYEIDVWPNLKVIPRFLAKSDGASTQLDLASEFRLFDNYWAVAAYRLGDEIGFGGGVDIAGKFRVGMTYGITTSAISGYSNGSWEAVLAVVLND